MAVLSLGAMATMYAAADTPSPPAETAAPIDDERGEPYRPSTAPESPPDAAGVAPSPAPDQAPPVERTPTDAVGVLEPSEPVSISIPGIGVDNAIMELGLEDDGTMEVPPHAPFSESQAGWYRHSPTPGQFGPSVVVGHVDSEQDGPSVFFELDTLAPGDQISIPRADGVTAVFAVDRTEQYQKDAFPTLEVFGDIDHAGLRLITCGGVFDNDEREYEDNIVVYAHLVSTHPS